jgi:hypothetical protein
MRCILPAGQKLPGLKVLRIACNPGGRTCVDLRVIRSIADCCTTLEELALHNVVPWGLDRSCLSRLPSSLHALSLEGTAIERGTAQFVAGLTSLRSLHLRDNKVDDKELQELTALTRLTGLQMEGLWLKQATEVRPLRWSAVAQSS